MGYAQHVGRVGALAVALGIGVAVANGGIANATTDPDADPGAAQGGDQDPGTPPVDNPGTDAPETPQGPETPGVVINGVEQNDNQGATVSRRTKPRVMILDILRGENLLGARRSVDQNPPPTKPDADDNEQPQVVPDEGGTAVKLVAPSGSDPVKPVAPTPRFIQRTLAAISAPPAKPKITPSAKGPIVKPVAALDPGTTQIQRQAATITGPSTLDAPSPAPPQSRPSPTRIILNLLSSIGLRPENFPPGSPLAPIGRVLEFVFAGLRRVDHQLFNQAPVATSQPISAEEAEEFGTDPTTGVTTGRVAYDPDDALEFDLVEAPQHGTVEFHPDGTYTYTPFYDEAHGAAPTATGLAVAAVPPTTDRFVVEIREADPNHLHLAGGEHITTAEVNLDLAPNLTTLEQIEVGNDATDVAVTPDGGRLYVTNFEDKTVSVIDTASGQVIDVPKPGGAPGETVNAIPIASNPNHIAINGTGTRAYVTNLDDTVSIIDIDPGSATYNRVIATTGEIGPSGAAGAIEDIAVDPATGNAVVTTFNSAADGNNVWVLDPNSGAVLTSFAVDDYPGHLTFNTDKDRHLLYVSDIGDAEVLVIDMNPDPTHAATYKTVIARIDVGGINDPTDAGTAQGLASNEDGTRLYVVNNEDGSVRVIDTQLGSDDYNMVVKTIDEGIGPDLFMDDVVVRGNRAFVQTFLSDSIIVIDTDTNEVIYTVPIQQHTSNPSEAPWALAMSPDGTRLYVANADPSNIWDHDGDPATAMIAENNNDVITVIAVLQEA